MAKLDVSFIPFLTFIASMEKNFCVHIMDLGGYLQLQVKLGMVSTCDSFPSIYSQQLIALIIYVYCKNG